MKSTIAQVLPSKQPKPPRERGLDKNTVVRPKRKNVVTWTGPAETVEQFEDRGGKVQRLTASWEQAA